jgi:hypothetical protein
MQSQGGAHDFFLRLASSIFPSISSFIFHNIFDRTSPNEMHQPASEKAKVENTPRFHAGRLDACVICCLFVNLSLNL